MYSLIFSYLWGYACLYMEVRGQLVPNRSPFYHIDAGNSTQMLHLGSRCLYTLSLFAGLKASWFLFVCFKIHTYIHGSFVCMDMVCHGLAMTSEARRWNWICWTWSYRHLWTSMWVLVIKPGSLKEQPVLLTAKLCLQFPKLIWRLDSKYEPILNFLSWLILVPLPTFF